MKYDQDGVMRYHALAADYDGTLATDGQVSDPTVRALERLLASGRKLIMVTGRELDQLQSVFPHLALFDRVVAENGAWLYRPATQDHKRLAAPPPDQFIDELQRRGVPLSVGEGIVATWTPHEKVVLEVIRDLGLELHVIFNKGAVMILPAGVNKATGLTAALRESGLSPHNVVGVGDAENDHAFLNLCECGVAVSNALPMLKAHADWVTKGDHGDGVVELIDALLEDDLQSLDGRLVRHHLLLGTAPDGSAVHLPAYGSNLLVTGSSGSGKSTLTTGLLERMAEAGYQFCIIDPEGDYEGLERVVVLGDTQRVPTVKEVLQLLQNPDEHVVVNLLGLPLADRPGFFVTLFPQLQEFRARTGRPHWIVVDEAHHLLPAGWDPTTLSLSQKLYNLCFVTVHPDQLAPAVLSSIDRVAIVGRTAAEALGSFSAARRLRAPHWSAPLESGEALYWRLGDADPVMIQTLRARAERRRHRRKYAQGELAPDESFYFVGPEGKLNLRAQNLILFVQIADGVDDATWMYHLNRGDYSDWFRQTIKDEALAGEAHRIEATPNITPADSRAQIKAAIEQRYTLSPGGLVS